jgi:isocitrate dehydrogenase (NAD+)
LKHVDKPELAVRLQTAVEQTLQADNVRTGDLGGKASTRDFAAAIVKRLAH